MDWLKWLLRIAKIGTGSSNFFECIVIRRLRMEELLEDIVIDIIHDFSVAENNYKELSFLDIPEHHERAVSVRPARAKAYAEL